ncbi:MAG: DUF2125 domain-containing protein [Nitratireductor sp.]
MSKQQSQNEHSGARTRKGSGIFRIVALIAVIVSIGFAWNWAWQQAAQKLDAAATVQIEKWNDAGIEITCPNRLVIGFPFRIGIHCDSLSVFDTVRSLKIEAGELRSAAQFYKPGHAIAELDGPLLSEFPGGEKTVTTWENLKASIVVGLGGWQRISVEASAPKGSGTLPGPQPFDLWADNIQLHARIPDDGSDTNSLDVAFSASNLSLESRVRIPTVGMAGNLRLDQIANQLHPGFKVEPFLRQSGLSGKIGELALEPAAGGRFSVSGPFSVSATGLLSGKLTLAFTDAAQLMAFATAAGGDDNLIAQAGQILAMIPASGNGGARKITLVIEDGVVSAGFFKLGEIPPLF